MLTMIQTISIYENITLKELQEKFNLQRTDERDFFTEWFENLPDITDSDKQFLNRVKNRYFYLLDDGSLLEEGVKMMIVSPLLEVAGFSDPPFKTRFEPAVQIAVDDREEILRGRIDALVVQNQLWG